MESFPFTPGERVRFSAVLAHPFPGPIPGYGERGTILEAPPINWVPEPGQDARYNAVLVAWDFTGVVPSLIGNINYVWHG
jgi:hypothetical protein